VGGGIGIDINATSANIMINNNYIHDYKLNDTNNIYNQCIGIRIASLPKVDILNNYIKNCFDSIHGGSEYTVGMGIYVLNSLDVRILGNIIQECYVQTGASNNIGNAPVFAPLGVLVQNNLFLKISVYSTTVVRGGVLDTDSLFGDPKFDSSGDLTLAPDSPAIDAGPPDPQYNDRDGSRNDIGMFGGHNFIPDGRTTDKPIVLGLDVAPIAVPTGGTVTIESTGATVK